MNKIITKLRPDRKYFWINISDIEEGLFPGFIQKLDDIMINRSEKYSGKSISIAKNICEHLTVMGYITWKQHDCIINMRQIPPPRNYKNVQSNGKKSKSYLDFVDMELRDVVKFGINFKGLVI